MAPTTIDAPSDTAAEAQLRAPAAEAAANEADGFHDELAVAREAEGLDGSTALPKAADDVAAEVPGEVIVEGQGALSTKVGGKKPTSSKCRLTGGAFGVTGKLEKGSTVTFELKARVSGEHYDDVLDGKTQQAVDCVLTQPARIIGAVRIEQSVIDKHEELVEAVQGHLAGSVSREALEALVGGE